MMLLRAIRSWWKNEEGVAAIEAALLFPLMVLLMAGVYDVGQAIVLSGRTVTASQVVADLISRNKTVNLTQVNDNIKAAELVFQPHALNNFGIDIASVQFDNNRRPIVLWRQTRSMSPNNNAVESLNGVGTPGDGMVVVTVKYNYTPVFTKYFPYDFSMTEVAYARGRRSPTITWGG